MSKHTQPPPPIEYTTNGDEQTYQYLPPLIRYCLLHGRVGTGGYETCPTCDAESPLLLPVAGRSGRATYRTEEDVVAARAANGLPADMPATLGIVEPSAEEIISTYNRAVGFC